MFKSIGYLNWVLATIGGGICLIALIILTVVTVFGRYILEADLIPGGYNMIESVFFPLMVFWGLPLAHRDGLFPRLEVLNSVSVIFRRPIALLVLLVEVIVYAIVLFYCSKFAMNAIETGRQIQIGTGYWLAWPVIIMGPLSFALMTLEVFRLLVEEIRSIEL